MDLDPLMLASSWICHVMRESHKKNYEPYTTVGHTIIFYAFLIAWPKNWEDPKWRIEEYLFLHTCIQTHYPHSIIWYELCYKWYFVTPRGALKIRLWRVRQSPEFQCSSRISCEDIPTQLSPENHNTLLY